MFLHQSLVPACHMLSGGTFGACIRNEEGDSGHDDEGVPPSCLRWIQLMHLSIGGGARRSVRLWLCIWCNLALLLFEWIYWGEKRTKRGVNVKKCPKTHKFLRLEKSSVNKLMCPVTELTVSVMSSDVRGEFSRVLHITFSSLTGQKWKAQRLQPAKAFKCIPPPDSKDIELPSTCCRGLSRMNGIATFIRT